MDLDKETEILEAAYNNQTAILCNLCVLQHLNWHFGGNFDVFQFRHVAANLLYLPPYSPDFNPIENAFTKLKALLRAKAERTIAALWETVGLVIDLFIPAECANYFKAAGYEPD
ncbi:MAG: hypothetical protein EOQ44_32055 [Mesorhizobium sp.]|nr:MAG: hypothetical protein EOQ44_32055 [Mesorhizobium sp.]